MSKAQEKRQSLYLVLGGELENLNSREFRDPGKIDLVGIFSDYTSAQVAWKAKAQATVDNALQRYYVIDLNRIPGLQADNTVKQKLS